MRLLTSAIVLVLIAGCASKPSTTSAPAASPAPATTAEPPAKAAVATADDASKTMSYSGYKAKQKDGVTVYCKKIAKTGSRFEDEVCMTAAEIDQVNAQAEADRVQFRKNQTVCGTGGCGGS